MSTNILSSFGRMNYATHLLMYPLIGGSFFFMYSSYSTKQAARAEKEIWDNMPKPRPVDPDNFNPFSAIPFHNNPENRYRYANVRMHQYVDHHTHMNLKDYAYKYYHDSFDHQSKHVHLNNYVSSKPSDHAPHKEAATHHA